MSEERIECFGDYLRALRKRNRITLREFCKRASADPANISRMERSLMAPPRDPGILRRYATALDLEEGTEPWHRFFDSAAANRGMVPEDIMSDAELVKRLPAFFRTLRGEKPTAGDMERLANKIKEEGL